MQSTESSYVSSPEEMVRMRTPPPPKSLPTEVLWMHLLLMNSDNGHPVFPEEAHGLVTRGTCSLVSDGAIRDVTIPSPTLLYSPLVSIQVNSEWSRVGCWCSSILEKRRAETERIRENYPDRIPVRT
ncbi:hypothetical protein Pint_16066 [Pistacia integerrima]|uniref:Uncharacterized protein n=1 Tax=Pistacia integerrima TaxID=434235 RepID=A0ACC0ZD96_9ROSI|nr:hypothetical protein Pint_16066 [Pistacia integerrima]